MKLLLLFFVIPATLRCYLFVSFHLNIYTSLDQLSHESLEKIKLQSFSDASFYNEGCCSAQWSQPAAAKAQ
jgi:hypothetical protein